MHNYTPGNTISGFTLVELVIFIVVLALGITGTVLLINRSVALAPQALEQTRAMEIAQAYLDEIGTKRYDENTAQGGLPACDSPTAPLCSNVLGAETGESRASFNDVDDFNGIDDNPPLNANGNIIPNYSDYRVRVVVAYAGSELGLANNRLAKRIDVIIDSPFGQHIPVSMYRTNY